MIKKLLMVVGVLLTVGVFAPAQASVVTAGDQPACGGAQSCWLT
ncbi:hypothetical protein AB0E69_14600 [Kribbella sp. NPDC026611]